MTFPVSGVETAIWVPPLVGLVISFFTSMGGISGAFLILPFQMSYPRFYQPRGNPNELGVQCCRHPKRCVPLFQRRPYELAPGLEHHRGNTAGPCAGTLHTGVVFAGPKSVQALRGLRPVLHWRPHALSADRRAGREDLGKGSRSQNASARLPARHARFQTLVSPASVR